MKAFVTGGTGLVGKQLVRRLLADGHDVRVLVRDAARGAELARAGARQVLGELGRPETFREAAASSDVVFHCAAQTGFWNVPWEEFRRVNVDGTRNLLEASAGGARPRVVHASTVFVYGHCNQDPRPRTEGDAAGVALGGYERSKLEAEELALSYARERGVDVRIARLTSIYGAEGKFIPTLVDGLREGRLKLIGDGSNRKHVTHVSDCVEGLVRAAAHGRPGAVYNIGAAEVPTMAEIVAVAAETLGVPPPPSVPRPLARGLATIMEVASRLTGRPPPLTRAMVDYLSLHNVYDVTRARQELGFVAAVGHREGIAAAVREYRAGRSAVAEAA